MATNQELQKALLKKLNVTRQRLSQRAQAMKRVLPMTTEQAVYVIAHEEGLDITRYLSGEETAEVRQLVSCLGPAAPKERQDTAAPRGHARPVRVTISVSPAALGVIASAHANEAKMMAERVYPMLYLFENSLRDLIERVLRAAYGDEWWAEAVPKKVRDTAERHKTSEDKNAWHERRGRRDVEYVYLAQLWDIIKHQWQHFADLFPNQAWIEALVTNDMSVSRNVIAHMNPLGNDDVRNIEAAFNKWARQLKAVEGRLP